MPCFGSVEIVFDCLQVLDQEKSTERPVYGPFKPLQYVKALKHRTTLREALGALKRRISGVSETRRRGSEIDNIQTLD